MNFKNLFVLFKDEWNDIRLFINYLVDAQNVVVQPLNVNTFNLAKCWKKRVIFAW